LEWRLESGLRLVRCSAGRPDILGMLDTVSRGHGRVYYALGTYLLMRSWRLGTSWKAHVSVRPGGGVCARRESEDQERQSDLVVRCRRVVTSWGPDAARSVVEEVSGIPDGLKAERVRARSWWAIGAWRTAGGSARCRDLMKRCRRLSIGCASRASCLSCCEVCAAVDGLQACR